LQKRRSEGNLGSLLHKKQIKYTIIFALNKLNIQLFFAKEGSEGEPCPSLLLPSVFIPEI
jgi:hypothetical protein